MKLDYGNIVEKLYMFCEKLWFLEIKSWESVIECEYDGICVWFFNII